MTDYPPAGTWDVIDRHGEPRYVVEHDGNGGFGGVCQPDNPEHCHVLAASKDLLAALKLAKKEIQKSGNWTARDFGWSTVQKAINDAIAKAEGR